MMFARVIVDGIADKAEIVHTNLWASFSAVENQLQQYGGEVNAAVTHSLLLTIRDAQACIRALLAELDKGATTGATPTTPDATEETP